MLHVRQSAAAVDPVDAVYVPAAHEVQLTVAVEAAYWPAGHAVHDAEAPPAL